MLKGAVGRCDAQFFVQNLAGRSFTWLKPLASVVIAKERYTQIVLLQEEKNPTFLVSGHVGK